MRSHEPTKCTSWPPPASNIRSMVGGSSTNTRSQWPRTAVPKRVFACERMFHPPREKPLWHKGFCSLPAVRPCFACVIMRTPVRCMGYRCSVLPEQLFVAGCPGYEHMCGLGELIRLCLCPWHAYLGDESRPLGPGAGCTLEGRGTLGPAQPRHGSYTRTTCWLGG